MKNKIEAIYPLSPMQEGMLFHKLYNEKSTEYVVRFILKLTGELELSRVRESLDLLTEKYDVLRTSVVMPKKGDRPWQVVLTDRKIELNIIDFSTAQPSVEQIEKLKDDDLSRGFDLEKDSLLRVTIIKLPDNENIVLWSLHHIILDGWCSSLVLINFIQNYADLINGKSVNGIKEAIKVEKSNVASYGDYIKWLEKQDKKAAMKYWSELLADYSENAAITPIGANIEAKEEMKRFTLDVGTELSEKVKETAKQKRITINTILESALGILLQRYNNNDDVVFGKVTSGRSADIMGIDQIVGLFINTIPVRVKSDKDSTCEQLLDIMHKQAIDSSCYDYCSLADIQSHSGCGNELIKILFVYENYFIDNAAIDQGKNDLGGKLKVEIGESREQTNYPLNVSVSMSDTLKLDIIYNPAMFSMEEIQVILERYRCIIQHLVEHPNMRLDEIDLVLDEEKERILNEFNASTVEYPNNKTVVDLLEERVASVPDKVAVVFGEQKLTYNELNQKANQLALKLRELGVKCEDFVAVMAERSIEIIIGIYGIIKAGGTIIVIDPEYPKDRIDYILGDCKPKALLTYGIKYETEVPVIDLSSAMTWEGVQENIKTAIRPDNLMYLIYTSGTTGKPKGVMIEHRSVIRLVCGANYVELNEDTVLLQTGSLSFDAATFEIWGTLLNGGELHLAKKDVILDSSVLKRTIEENTINTMFLTTALFNQLINLDKTVFDSIDTLMFGGEKASEAHVRKLMESNRKINLVNLYGPTETTTLATWYPISNDTLKNMIPIGKPVSNTKTYVMNGLNLCGIGMSGELCVTGVGVARGYLNHPELTAEKFIDNPFGEGKMYRSGDVARWLPDGNIEFIGRVDGQVKLRGFRIELGEIEKAIRNIDVVQDVAVIVKEDNGEKNICAYIVAEASTDIADIRERLQKELPNYMIPAYMLKMDKLPVNRNGKVDKKALPKIEIKSGHEYVAPRNETEEAIVKVFEEVLGIEKVGLKDNFYELGGDSIKAIRLLSKLRGLNCNITMRELIQEKTIEYVVAKACGVQKYEKSEDAKASSMKNSDCSNNREGLEINTLAIIEDTRYDSAGFRKTKLYEEFLNYENNRSQGGISESFEPFAYEKFFLIEQPENIVSTKTTINGQVSQEELISVVRSVVKEQSICRYSYDITNNLFHEHKYFDNWYVPYIDLCNTQDVSEALAMFESIENISRCFKEKQLLVKIVIVKATINKHIVYSYAQHSVWDYMSAEILGALIKNKLLGTHCDTTYNGYSHYIKERRNTEKQLQSETSEFIRKFMGLVKNYELLTDGQKPKYCVEIKNKVSQGMVEYILENPIQWGLQLFSLINIKAPNNFTDKTFPFILVHFNNVDDRKMTLGLYLESILQTFDATTGNVTKALDSKYSYSLFESEYLDKKARMDYFEKIPSINFVTAFNSSYILDDFGDYKIEVSKISESLSVKGHITIRIINDVMHLLIPSFDKDIKRITEITKKYLGKS